MFSHKKDLENFISNKNFEKIFILTGRKSFKGSGADKILKRILNKKIVKFYFKTSSYPEFNELKKINISLRKFAPDLLIAVGGGSVLDYAKIANSIDFKDNLRKNITNLNYSFKRKVAKLVAIPTTAGSGSEVTANAVIYINKIKYSVEGRLVKPDYFFLMPNLVINNPKKLKAASGFDAIAQAVESMLSRKSNETSLSYAKKSLKISIKNYIDYIKNPTYNNSSAMCLAANLSGQAINISKTTAPHAVSYPFTSLYKLSHGHAVSLTLEKFLKFNFMNIQHSSCKFNLANRYKSIFKLFNVKNIIELENFIKVIKNKAGLESDFNILKINLNNNIDKILDGVNLNRLNNNPVTLNKKDIKNILIKFN